MADVFLSYARGDRAVAERLAHAITGAGLSIWWDRHIKGGAEFSSDIEQQLDSAARILVLWSKEAVVSRWVRDEASVAADSKRLVSASIDGTPPPLGFRQFQTIDLKAWAAKGAALPPELAEALEVEPPASVPPPPARKVDRRWIAASAAALLVAGAVTVAIVRPEPLDRFLSGEPRNDELSLAIMPFVTQDGAGIDYLGPGLSSALADSLSPLSGLKITASTSTQALAGKGLTAPDIAKKLGITHLIEGNLQHSGERYSISVRLIDARTSEQIWARSFDGQADELQQIKERMARELAGGLIARLGVGQGDIAERRDVDPRAFEAYLRALERVSVRDNIEARQEAIKQFRLAASMQPDFAEAHAGYAYLMALSVPEQLGMPWREIIAEQRRATARALELDPNNDFALIAEATALQNFHGEIHRSGALAQAVLNRSPNFAPAHYSLATSLLMAGRTRAALGHLEQAIDLDPFDNLMRMYRVKTIYSLGDYEGLRGEANTCVEDCGGLRRYWSLAMIGFATPAQLRDDLPKFVEQGRVLGLPVERVVLRAALAQALVLNRPHVMPKIDDPAEMGFPNAAMAARLIGFEEGLRYARVAADRTQPDSVIDILNDGRATFTPEQRADPRYHQLFRHPKLVKIATARRKQGVTGGLPIFPVKPYAGR